MEPIEIIALWTCGACGGPLFAFFVLIVMGEVYNLKIRWDAYRRKR